MTDPKNTDPKNTEATAAEELTDEAVENAEGGYSYRLTNAMVTSYNVNGATRVEDDEPIAMSKGFSINPTAAFDIEEMGVLRKRPTR